MPGAALNCGEGKGEPDLCPELPATGDIRHSRLPFHSRPPAAKQRGQCSMGVLWHQTEGKQRGRKGAGRGRTWGSCTAPPPLWLQRLPRSPCSLPFPASVTALRLRARKESVGVISRSTMLLSQGLSCRLRSAEGRTGKDGHRESRPARPHLHSCLASPGRQASLTDSGFHAPCISQQP